MNEQLKKLIEQAGLSALLGNNWLYGEELEEFAELVRDDERAKCASDYLQDCCDAIDAAKLEERASCAQLLEDFAKTQMVPAKDTWRMGVMAAANAVRNKK